MANPIERHQTRARLLTRNIDYLALLLTRIKIVVRGQWREVVDPCQSNLITSRTLGELQGFGGSEECPFYSESTNGKYIPTFIEVLASIPSDKLAQVVVVEVEETAELVPGNPGHFSGKIRFYC